jgi:hypothetical protein
MFARKPGVLKEEILEEAEFVVSSLNLEVILDRIYKMVTRFT